MNRYLRFSYNFQNKLKMMIKNLLLAALLLSYLSNSQINLQSQYCSLKTNTTG